jgi:hypothetical protein
MKGFSERINGRDSVSGTMVKIGVIHVPEAANDQGLLTVMIKMDSGCSVVLMSSQDGIEKMIERRDRTATFVGEFVDEARQNLFSDEVYFWSETSEA